MHTLTLEQLEKKLAKARQDVQELEELHSLFVKHADVESRRNGASHRSSAKKKPSRTVAPPNANGLKDAVLGLNFQSTFTVDDVVKQLKARNLNFDRRQVRDSLHVLVKKGHGVRRVKQGLGGEQTLYEKTA